MTRVKSDGHAQMASAVLAGVTIRQSEEFVGQAGEVVRHAVPIGAVELGRQGVELVAVEESSLH